MHVLYLFSQKIMGGHLFNSMELFALCCLTLTWKIRNMNFTIHQLQVNLLRIMTTWLSSFFTYSLHVVEQVEKLELRVVTQKKFETMELNILKKLGWYLCSITPLCFLLYLDLTCGFHLKTSSETIIQSINGNENWKFCILMK